MADTYTSNIRTALQVPGSNNNSWGTILNANFNKIDAKFGAVTAISTTGGNTTLTETQEVVGTVDVSGTLVANAVIIFSGRGGFWVIANRTTGNYSVTCKVTGQTGITIEQGGAALVYCTGTDIALGNPPATAVAEVTVASATTTEVLGITSEFAAISGTTTITSFGTGTNRKRFCRATGAFKITHNSTSLICPGGQDITTAAGDTFIIVADASSNVRVIAYQRVATPPQSVPVGAVIDYAGASAPSFWLFSYGQTVSRTTYAALFAAIGETYGAGNGATTFQLPDLRGRVVAGRDDMGGSAAGRLTGVSGSVTGTTLGGTGGEEAHTLSTGETPSHTHAVGSLTMDSQGAHTHTINNGTNILATPPANSFGLNGGSNGGYVNLTTASSGAHTHTISGSTASAGSGSAHNNVQPTIVLNKIIFAGVV